MFRHPANYVSAAFLNKQNTNRYKGLQFMKALHESKTLDAT